MTADWKMAIVRLHAAHVAVGDAEAEFPQGSEIGQRLAALQTEIADLADAIESDPVGDNR